MRGHFECEIKIMSYECLVYFVLRLLFEASIKHQACCVSAKQRFEVCYPIRASYKNRLLHRKCAVRIFVHESQNFRNERVSVAYYKFCNE